MRRAALLQMLASIAALAVASCERAPPPQSATPALDGLMADYVQAIAAESPETAAAAGLPASRMKSARGLDDRGPDAAERRRVAMMRLAAQMRAANPASADQRTRVAFEALSWRVRTAEAGAEFQFGRLEPSGDFAPYVVANENAAFLALPDFFALRMPVRSLADGHVYVERLREVARAIDDETARARIDAAAGIVPPAFVLDRVASGLERAAAVAPEDSPYVADLRTKLSAIVALTATEGAAAQNQSKDKDQDRDQNRNQSKAEQPAKANPAPGAAEAKAGPPAPASDAISVARAQGLLQRATDIARTQIHPALARSAALLRAQQAQSGGQAGVVARLPKGEAYYAAAMERYCGRPARPQELERQAEDRLNALRQDADGALRVLGLTDGAVGERFAVLAAAPERVFAADPAGEAALLAAMNAQVERAQAAAAAGAWTFAQPIASLSLQAAPDWMANAPWRLASYVSLSAPGSGAAVGIVRVTPRGPLAATRLNLPARAAAEAIPGRHLLHAFLDASGHTQLAPRIGLSVLFRDSWASYAQILADEAGLFADPIARLGFLQTRLSVAAAQSADVRLHALGWTRDAVLADYRAKTGASAEDAAYAIDWIAAHPAQACAAETGARALQALRARAQRGLGPAFDLRRFHELALSHGDAPPPVLAQRVERWIHAEAPRDQER